MDSLKRHLRGTLERHRAREDRQVVRHVDACELSNLPVAASRPGIISQSTPNRPSRFGVLWRKAPTENLDGQIFLQNLILKNSNLTSLLIGYMRCR